jgi:hypothetical protein
LLDEEFLGLVERAIKVNLKPTSIKQTIQNWKPDYNRIELSSSSAITHLDNRLMLATRPETFLIERNRVSRNVVTNCILNADEYHGFIGLWHIDIEYYRRVFGGTVIG